jgi:Family of unknown function (DUF6220)
MTTGRRPSDDAAMPPVVRDRRSAGLGLAVAAWLFVACIVVQVFLVGLDIFAKMGGSIHRDFAYVYGWLAPILVLLANLARAPAPIRYLTLVLLGLFAAQTVLPSLRDQIPVLAAIHTVNALLIFGLAVVLAQRATAWVRTDAASP